MTGRTVRGGGLFVFVCKAFPPHVLIWFWSYSLTHSLPPDDSGDDCPAVPPSSGQGGGCRNLEIQSTLRTLGSKVEDLNTCNDLIVKHGSALQRY